MRRFLLTAGALLVSSFVAQGAAADCQTALNEFDTAIASASHLPEEVIQEFAARREKAVAFCETGQIDLGTAMLSEMTLLIQS